MTLDFLKRPLFWGLAILLSGLSQSYAQNAFPAFRHFSVEDGMPSTEVYSMMQDCHKNLWFATDRGICKYNGYDFKTYAYKEGLTDNTVFYLQEDTKGRIWAYTFSGRMFYLENEKFVAYKYNDLLVAETQSRIPLGFYVDSADQVTVAILSRGTFSINHTGSMQWRLKSENLPGKDFVIDQMAPGFYLNTMLTAVDRDTTANFIFNGLNGKEEFAVSANLWNRVVVLNNSEGNLVFSIGKKLFLKKGKNVQVVHYFKGTVYSIARDNKGRYLVGTENGAYVFDDLESGEYMSHYLVDKSITSIMQDHEGGYWFSTLDNSVYYLASFGINGITFSDKLFEKPLSLAVDHSSNLYVGFFDGHILKIKNSLVEQEYAPADSPVVSPIYNITSFANDPKVYFTRSRPGYFLNGEMHLLNNPKRFGIKTDYFRKSDGSIYVGGTSFIFRVIGNDLYVNQFTSNRVNCLFESNDGELIAGTNRGVIICDSAKGTVKDFRKELADIRVDDICRLGDKLLFGTKGKGLMILSNNTFITIDESNGLGSNLINKLIARDNDVWIAGNKGVSHIHFLNEDLSRYTIANLSSTDGLFSNEVNDLVLVNDTIYVASNIGISYFNTKLDFVNRVPPSIYISSLRVNDNDTLVSSQMRFDHSSNDLQIGFTGVSFRSNGSMLYRYQLICDQDTISSFTKNRAVEFLSLQAGKYTFIVYAKNNSGVWSTAPAVFNFEIHPAWWQTWWFKVIVSLMITLMIYLFYRSKVKKLEYEFEMERRNASLQLTAMRAQMNPHFIFNVMNSIRIYMQDHDMKSAEKYLTSFSKLVRYTLENSEMQVVTLEEELQALRNYADLEMQQFEKGFDFIIQIKDELEVAEIEIPSMLLQPFIENSIKHGISRIKHRGRITLSIAKSDSQIQILIDDNGTGLEESKEWNSSHRGGHHSKGTSLIFERIKAFNKAYNKNITAQIVGLKDETGASIGTRVIVYI
jgi:ligand-binding sensor domain-containing protein